MKLERVGPTTVRMTAHPYELATLLSAARWAVEGGQGELSEEAVEQLRRVLAMYEQEVARLRPSTTS
jgi:hypothetical protein